MAGPDWTGLLIWEQLFITGLFHGVRHFASFCLSFSALDGGMAPGHIVCSELECCHASSQWFASCDSRLWKMGKCVSQTWECGAECDINVTQCRMLRKVCGRMELCVSSIRIFKSCFSTYGGFNVLLQSALHPGFTMLFNVRYSEQRQNNMQLVSCTERVYVVHMQCSMALFWDTRVQQSCYSEEAKSNKSRTDPWLLLRVELFTLHSNNM